MILTNIETTLSIDKTNKIQYICYYIIFNNVFNFFSIKINLEIEMKNKLHYLYLSSKNYDDCHSNRDSM